MFNKRKKEREQQKIMDIRALQNKRIESAIEDAGKIDDPAQRLLRLEEIRQIAIDEIRREKTMIEEKADLSTRRGIMGGSGLAGVGGAVAATVTTGGIGAFVAVPLLIGGLIVGIKHGDNVEAKAWAEAKDYLEAMQSQHQRITDLMAKVVQGNVEKISKSPSYEQVLALPGLVASFAEAAQKHIVTSEKAAKADEVKKPAAPDVKKQAPGL